MDHPGRKKCVRWDTGLSGPVAPGRNGLWGARRSWGTTARSHEIWLIAARNRAIWRLQVHRRGDASADAVGGVRTMFGPRRHFGTPEREKAPGAQTRSLHHPDAFPNQTSWDVGPSARVPEGTFAAFQLPKALAGPLWPIHPSQDFPLILRSWVHPFRAEVRAVRPDPRIRPVPRRPFWAFASAPGSKPPCGKETVTNRGPVRQENSTAA